MFKFMVEGCIHEFASFLSLYVEVFRDICENKGCEPMVNLWVLIHASPIRHFLKVATMRRHGDKRR